MKTKPITLKSLKIGDGRFTVMAGPCSIESRDQLLATAEHVKSQGAVILRGGIFKLRTRPDSFQGLGAEAMALASAIKNQLELPFIAEITDPRQLEALDAVVDIHQVGARNMYNYELLKELSRSNKPVLLKRAFSATLDEWLHAADYIAQEGRAPVMLCERGIRTFETKMRNTFDINAVAWLKQHSEHPVIADTSHGTGSRELVGPVALAAAAAGADGLLVEVHPQPSEAKSDGQQALTFEDFSQLMRQLESLLAAFDRKLNRGNQ